MTRWTKRMRLRHGSTRGGGGEPVEAGNEEKGGEVGHCSMCEVESRQHDKG